MPKLHEIIAVATGKKADVEREVTDAYKLIQRDGVFDGLHKTYAPAVEGGETLPDERKNIQVRSADVIDAVSEMWTGLFDIVLTQDSGNQLAKADIVVGGKDIVENVPVPTLLFLEKQLQNVKSFIEKLPTPDPAEQWSQDANTSSLVTSPTRTARTKKTQKAIVKYPHTEHHPAQTEMVTEDVLAGYWTTIKQTARVPSDRKIAMLKRVSQLIDAVKTARERANSIAVEDRRMGNAIFSFIFGGN